MNWISFTHWTMLQHSEGKLNNGHEWYNAKLAHAEENWFAWVKILTLPRTNNNVQETKFHWIISNWNNSLRNHNPKSEYNVQPGAILTLHYPFQTFRHSKLPRTMHSLAPARRHCKAWRQQSSYVWEQNRNYLFPFSELINTRR